MDVPVESIVAVSGFCFLLWWVPAPFMLLPALSALVFPLYPVEAASISFVVGLVWGALVRLIKVGMQ